MIDGAIQRFVSWIGYKVVWDNFRYLQGWKDIQVPLVALSSGIDG